MFKFPSYIFGIQFASFLLLVNPGSSSSRGAAGTGAGCWLRWLVLATTAPRDFSYMLHTYRFTRLNTTKVKNYVGLKVRPNSTPFLLCPRCSKRPSWCCGRAAGRPAEHNLVPQLPQGSCTKQGTCPQSGHPALGHAAAASHICWPTRVRDWLHRWVSPEADARMTKWAHYILPH